MVLFCVFSLVFTLLSMFTFTGAVEWQGLVKEVPLCGPDVYFEMVLTTWHYEPVTALESMTLRSKINNKRDKSDLDMDIAKMCSDYAAVNCDDIAELIYAKYDQFIAKLAAEEAEGKVPGQSSCPRIQTVDFGYDQHKTSGKSLTAQKLATPTQPSIASEVTTIVSGYWRVQNKYSEEGKPPPHEAWMHNSLSLHMPYVFFTDPSHVDLIRRSRGSLPTKFALRTLPEFMAYTSYNSSWVHPEHVPNKDLATIWLEKINLMYLATLFTNSTFYAWVDAGLGTFRSIPMPQEEWSLEVLQSLPPTRLSYAHAHGTYHDFAAGVMIARKEVIPIIHKLFYAEYERCARDVQDWRCGSEQFILTNVRNENPHLFHAMTYEYGDISHLWANRYPFNKSKK